jgi:phage baseplate assembly protein W
VPQTTKSTQTLQNVYSDFNMLFVPNPIKKDLGMIYDTDSVKQALINLILTKPYERLFHPEVSCNVTQLLFDNITSVTAISIKRSIQDVVANFEPRVKLNNVLVVADPDQNGYTVTIWFYVLSVTQVQTVSFFLERLR